MTDNHIVIGQNDIVQDNQVACKPSTTNMPCQKHGVVRTQLGESSISLIGLALTHKTKRKCTHLTTTSAVHMLRERMLAANRG